MANIIVANQNELIIDDHADFTDEILRANGLENVPNRATVVPNGSDSYIVKHENDELTPPPIETMDNMSMESLLNEAVNDSSDTIEVIEAEEVFEDVNLEEAATELLEQETVVEDSEDTTEESIEESDEESGDWDEDYEADSDHSYDDEDDTFDDDDPDSYAIVDTQNNIATVVTPEETTTVDLSDTEALNALREAIEEHDVTEEAIAEALEDAEEVVSDSLELDNNKLIDALPINAPIYAIADDTLRFSGATWYKDITEQKIIVAGQGGIGSWVSMILSRMHPKQILIYDDDIVEMVNMAGQLYNMQSIGKRKVNAMAAIIKDFSNYKSIMAIPERWTEDTTSGDIMICGFDNMNARKVFFNSWLRRVVNHPHPEECLFIDGRLAFEDMQVFCITGDDSYNIKRYNKEYLFTDDEAEATVCSMKQTTYCASMIGSIIVNLFTNYIANRQCPMMYDLPFKTYYNANNMYFKTES